ncbi:RDD family protein [Nocardioides sp. HDW12B]|uniref:RDD family protein n=1 Tax=Nocardioides sp. HDW12B TaxID=2714939 RepID=UPI00140ACBDA|nr:RDD family protein [Nocardioides sp. HDW12B]QIK66856.1 RDD family protein [Nocardioides sp. HDW12B]
MDSMPPPVAPHATADASVGQRVGALLLDTLLVMLPLFIVSGILFGESQADGGGASVSLTGIPFLLTVLVAFGYFFGLEAANGQTLGKRIVGTRVVSDKGPELTAAQALIRTVMRVVDGFAFYLVGFVAALASPKNQRLGDMAASTRVVRSR